MSYCPSRDIAASITTSLVHEIRLLASYPLYISWQTLTDIELLAKN